jgi:hypothetical protein
VAVLVAAGPALSATQILGSTNKPVIERTVLALRMKPIFEARALASYQANVGRPVKSSPISDAITPDIFTGEVQPVAPVKAPAPTWLIYFIVMA